MHIKSKMFVAVAATSVFGIGPIARKQRLTCQRLPLQQKKAQRVLLQILVLPPRVRS
jgi:hypothetical protein